MPVPEHFKVSFRGIIEGTPEQWSHSHSLTLAGGGNVENIRTSDLANAWGAMAAGVLSVAVKLQEIRCYRIGTNGRMVGNPNLRFFDGAARRAGTLDSVIYPPQVALAVTTQGANRGPGRFGRFYLPGPGFRLSSDRRIDPTDQAGILANMATFLKALRDCYSNPADPDWNDAYPINVSTLGGGGAGSYQRVETVRLGRVLDTVRRRRNAMDEDYRATALG